MLRTTHLHIEPYSNECEMSPKLKSGLFFFLLLTLSLSKFTFSRRKFCVESKYALYFSQQLRVKMF